MTQSKILEVREKAIISLVSTTGFEEHRYLYMRWSGG